MKKKRSKHSLVSQVLLYLLSFILFWSSFWIAEGFYPSIAADSGQRVSLFANQVNDSLDQTILNAIGQADRSILLIIYSLTDKAVIEALRHKSTKGVQVKVICDAKASPHVIQKLGKQVDLIRRFSPGLMHQKILVVDAEYVWIGSANMTGESLRMHANLMTMIHCPELAGMILKKSKGMGEYDEASPLASEHFMVGGQRLELCFLPDDKQAIGKIKQLIREANKTVRVAMFTWTRFDLAKAVIEAKKRGLDVQVVVDRHAGKGAGNRVVKMLKEGGVPVALSQGPALFHHKFLYLDGCILVHGSANWTKAAFTKNDDCFMIMRDLNEEQKNKLERIWEAILQDATLCQESR